MKKTTLLFCSSILLFLTGCAPKQTVNNGPVKDESKIYTVDKEKNTKLAEALFFPTDIVTYNGDINIDGLNESQKRYVKYNTNLRKLIKLAAEETLKNNKTHFILVEKNMNQLYDTPFVTFKDMNEYCFKNAFYGFKSNSACQSLGQTSGSYFKFDMLNNPDYTLPAFNAKDVINEINNYKLSMEEINKIVEVKK